jgi:hypothetical protein
MDIESCEADFPVRLMQRLNVLVQLILRAPVVVEHALSRLPTPTRGFLGRPHEFGHNILSVGPVAVEFEACAVQPKQFEAVVNDLQCSPLLADEQNSQAASDRLRDDVDDGL